MNDAPAPAFCFVHAADLHLDTPFSGIHAVAPEVAEELRSASLAAFDAIVALAIEREAAFVVIAGDIYDGPERGLRAQLRFHQGLERLDEAGIASFVVHGNHDPVSGWSAIRSWPKRATIFGATEVKTVPVLRDGKVLATVQGLSYGTREVTENLARRFSRPNEPGVHVGVLHCNLAGVATGYANYSPCTLEDLRATGLDYLALGHIHQYRLVSGGTDGDPWVVYPGNSQARSPKPSERGPKGAVVVHARDNKVDGVEFVACDRVRFDEHECDLTGLGDLGELDDRLAEIANESLAASDGRSVVLRVRLTGRSPLHHDIERSDGVQALLRQRRESSQGRRPFLWWDEIRNESSPELDLRALRDRGDFAADLLAVRDELQASPDLRATLVEDVLAGLPRPFLSRASSLFTSEHIEVLLDDATVTALASLQGDDG